jgi:hypothetical protein
MNAFQAAATCLTDDLLRYRRSWGLWLILIIAPIGARFLVDGSAVHIALGGHLLEMSSGAVGVTIGVVASAMLLPVGFLYLRSNVTRRRPWQAEDVTPAPRAAMVLGHFCADCVVLLAALAVATAAGWVLAWRAGHGPVDVIQLSVATWLIACPSLVCLVALRHLLNALPATRGALGDVLAFVCWIAMLAMPATVADRSSSFAVNMRDPGGYTRPIIGDAPLLDREFALGSGPTLPGRVGLDADAGLHAQGYAASRFAWLAIGLAAGGIAGLLDRPTGPRARKERRVRSWKWLPAPRPAAVSAIPARPAGQPWLILCAAEFRLIGRGAPYAVLALAAALLGLAPEYRHVGSPAALLLLVFALSTQAGRNEGRNLLQLTSTTSTPPLWRRAAFVVAGTAWSLLMALPSAAVGASPAPLLLASATGAGAAIAAACIAAFTRSAFAPRMLLLIAWYVYFAS